jgi:uncharacterized membrane protein YedE/YeeE
MENFTPVSSLIGGGLIGIAATLLLWTDGRIAGISNIVGGLVKPVQGEFAWRATFVAGLLVGVLAYRAAGGPMQSITIDSSVPLLIAGGLLTGLGTQLGGGCTSGHGVCGLARLSVRSVVATLVFFAVAALTVYLNRHVIGGDL